MKIRTKAFLETIGSVGACVATVLALEWISPKYGFVIFMSGVACYMIYILYNLRLLSLKREQDEVVDILKE